MKKLLFILILSLIACTAVFADVQSSRDSGLNWLLSHQNSDGSFGNQSDLMFRDTEEALITLNILNQKASQYQNGLQWIINNSANNIDFIARKILVFSNEGIDTTAGINKLLSNQNTDGGWGLAVYESDSLDTALVIQALKSINYSNQTVIQSALSYLISTQNTDGGWGFYQGDDSNVYMTAVVSITLQQFPMTTVLANSVNKSTDYLRMHQNADGGFVSNASTAYETSLAYIALVGVTTDNTILNNAINYLITNQMPNGSWGDDPYSTALALRALYLSENKPVPPSPLTTGTITGKVIDAATNKPLSGVLVVLEADPNMQTTTDSTGVFTLSNVPQGDQSVKFSLNGYSQSTANLNIKAGSMISLGNVPLLTNPTVGIIKGTVSDASNGQPLSDVVVTVTGSYTGTATTGADGTFTFINVTPGNVTISASKSGYYAISGTGTVVAGGILSFNPQLSTTPPTITTGTLIGKVFDEATKQPEGAAIVILGGLSTSTDAQGAFNLNNIEPNTYQATISAAGYASQIYQVMIVAGVTTDMQTIYLTPVPQSTTITGKITDASTGNPIAGADVEVIGTTFSAKTDSNGIYALTGINILSFNLTAFAIGYDGFPYDVATTGYGTYEINFALNPSQTSDVKITSLITDNTAYSAASPVKITAKIDNFGSADVAGTVLLEIINPEGNTVYAHLAVNTASGSQGDITPNIFSFLIGETSIETFWITNQYKPGQYSVVITLRDTNNQLLDKKGTTFTILATKILAGNIYMNPFVAQSGQPVSINANIRNAGNVPINSINLPLSITDQGETIPLLIVNRSLTSLNVGEMTGIDYGDFIPEKGGAYNLRISPDQIDISAQIYAILNIGPNVTGTFSIIPNRVSAGDQTVKGNIHLAADTQGSTLSTVPLEHSKVKVLLHMAYSPIVPLDSEFVKIIVDDGFRLHAHSEPLTKEVLSDVHILILPASSYFNAAPYSIDEINAIYDFVINGGSLFVIADHTGFGMPYESIINRFGASFNNNNIGSDLYIPKEFISPHEITEGMDAMYQYWSFGCNSFYYLPPEAQILAKYYNYNILVAIPNGGAAGKGKIVISSDANTFEYNSASIINENPTDKEGIALKGNSLFTRNAMRWLTPKVPVGVDTVLKLILPENINISLPNPYPSNIISSQTNLTEYQWNIPNVSSSGLDIDFYLNFKNLEIGKIYAAATDTYISFKNAYTGNIVTVPISIPNLQVDGFLNSTIALDKTVYKSNENVDITTIVSNNGSIARSPSAKGTIEDLTGNTVAEIANFQVDLPPIGWANRIKITIDHTKVDANLADFPVSVHLSAASGINKTDISDVFDKLGTNSTKIAVTTSDNVQCYVEIEKWDSINKNADLWVRVPTISSSEDTTLYLYYDPARNDNYNYVGNTGSDAAKKVWNNDYKAVWHMSQNPEKSLLLDSTPNSNNGTFTAYMSASDLIDGQIGKAIYFSGENDFISGINTGNNLPLGNSPRTISALIKSKDSSPYSRVIFNYGTMDKDEGAFYFYINQSGGVSTGSGPRFMDGYYTGVMSSKAVVDDDSWHYVVGIYEGPASTFKIYVDGVLDKFGGVTCCLPNTIAGNNWMIGTQMSPYYSFIGVIDELRITDTVLSPEAIKAFYYSNIDNLLAFGNVEQLDATSYKTFSFQWNTGRTIAGNYYVKAKLYENGIYLTEDIANFTILPDKTVSSKVSVDKISYSANEPVAITSTITSLSPNYIFQNLTARVSVLNTSGQVLFTEDKPVQTLVPGQLIELKTYWNTSTNPNGTYTVALEVIEGATTLSTSQSTFEIIGSSNTGSGLVGTITAAPNPIYQGNTETLTYNITNKGNEAISILNTKIIIVDPDTKEVKIEFTSQGAINISETIAGIQTASTAILPAKIYLAILQASTSTMPSPITLASATFEVKPALEATKKIPDITNLLVWINDGCHHHEKHDQCDGWDDKYKDKHDNDKCDYEHDNKDKDNECKDNHNNCDDSKCSHHKKCIRQDLLENILKETVTSYLIVKDKKDLEKELRNPYYTDIIILGEHHSIEDHYINELKEQIYSGKGIITSLYLKHGWYHDECSHEQKHDNLFGIKYKGQLSGDNHQIELLNSPISEPDVLDAKGNANKIEANDINTVAAWIEEDNHHKHKNSNKYPAIVLNTYGLGKTIYYAFDLGITLDETNYTKLAAIIKNSITYIHKPQTQTTYQTNQLIPVEIQVKSLGSAFNLKLIETYQQEIRIYDPLTGNWITNNPWEITETLPANETKTTLYYALMPNTIGTYTLKTDIGYIENNTYNLYQTLSLDINVDKNNQILTSDIITALNALTVSHNDKHKLRNAIEHIEKVQKRIIKGKHDIEQNIHDILTAIDSLISIKSADTSNARLMMDRLLGLWEGKWFLM